MADVSRSPGQVATILAYENNVNKGRHSRRASVTIMLTDAWRKTPWIHVNTVLYEFCIFYLHGMTLAESLTVKTSFI